MEEWQDRIIDIDSGMKRIKFKEGRRSNRFLSFQCRPRRMAGSFTGASTPQSPTTRHCHLAAYWYTNETMMLLVNHIVIGWEVALDGHQSRPAPLGHQQVQGVTDEV